MKQKKGLSVNNKNDNKIPDGSQSILVKGKVEKHANCCVLQHLIPVPSLSNSDVGETSCES